MVSKKQIINRSYAIAIGSFAVVWALMALMQRLPHGSPLRMGCRVGALAILTVGFAWFIRSVLRVVEINSRERALRVANRETTSMLSKSGCAPHREHSGNIFISLKQVFDFSAWSEDDLPEWFKMSILIVTIGSLIWALIAYNLLGSTRIGPPPASVFEQSAAIVMGVGALVFIITWRANIGGAERRMLYGIQAAGIWCVSLPFVVFPAVDRHVEAVQFQGPGVQQWTSILPIAQVQKNVTSGKGSGVHFWAVTTTGANQFEISRADYEAMGGDGSRALFESGVTTINASGYCLHLQVQRSGDAMRILDHAPFNPGTVIPCPPGTK